MTTVINRFPPYHGGGYGLRFGDIVAGLARRGHRTSVITSTRGAGGPRVDEGGIHRILDWTEPVHGVRGILRFARASARQTAVLRRTLAAERPDVIHVGNFCELSSALWPVLRERGVPIVADVSNEWLDDMAGTHGNWFRIWERPSASAASAAVKTILRLWVSSPWGGGLPTRLPTLGLARVYSTSSHWAATLTERYPDEVGEVLVCPSGIPLELFPFRPSDRPLRRVLYVGRIKRFKGIHTPVRALGKLPADFTLTIVGIPDDPEYEAELRALADEIAPGRVELRPPVARNELPVVFGEHDVLVFPTEGLEAFSRLIQEASACGLPVVATPNGGTAEAIEDGVNGRLYPPGDVGTLAGILAELAADEAQRRRLIRDGRAHVERVYAIEPAIDRIEAVLRDAVEAARR